MTSKYCKDCSWFDSKFFEKNTAIKDTGFCNRFKSPERINTISCVGFNQDTTKKDYHINMDKAKKLKIDFSQTKLDFK